MLFYIISDLRDNVVKCKWNIISGKAANEMHISMLLMRLPSFI